MLLNDELAALAEGLSNTVLTLIEAPGGYGKTTLAHQWRAGLEDAGEPMAWLSLSPAHVDTSLFLDDWSRAMAPLLGDEAVGFRDVMTRLVTQRGEPSPHVAARLISNELREIGCRPVMCFDAFEHLPKNSASFEIVDALLRVEPCPMRFVITTRGSRPNAATLLLASERAIVIRADDLSLHADQISVALEEEGVEAGPELVAQLLARTSGWAMGVRLASRALAGRESQDRLQYVRELRHDRDLLRYVGSELLGRATSQVVSLLEAAAVLGPQSDEILIASAGADVDERAVERALDLGLLQADAGKLALHDLWAEWLRERLRARSDDWCAAQGRAAQALEMRGKHRAALHHRIEIMTERASDELEDVIVRVLDQNGDAWLSQGHRRVVTRALEVLPKERCEREPGLIALKGLLLSGSDPQRALAHLKSAVESYRRAGNQRAEAVCLHELGIVAMNENRMHETLAVHRRAISMRRLFSDGPMRGMVLMALGAGGMLAGRFRMALRLTEASARYDHHPREQAGIVLVQSLILFHQGRWDEARRRIEALLERPEQRGHGTSYHALQINLCAIRSAQGESAHDIRDRLEEAIEVFKAAYQTVNRSRAEVALGLHRARHDNLEAATTHFTQAAELMHRIELWEAHAAALGYLARTAQRRGRDDEARHHAEQALQALDSPGAWSGGWGSAFASAPGIALACAVAANVGAAERAAAFVRTHRRRLVFTQLPSSAHAVQQLIARVFECAGDTRKAKSLLVESWRAAGASRLEDFAPELDTELLREVTVRARDCGVRSVAHAHCLHRFGLEAAMDFRVQTFGGLRVDRNGLEIGRRAWRGKTSRRLLVRLLVEEGRPVTRERLEADLWPELAGRRAHNNLSVALTRLRDALEAQRQRKEIAPLIEADGEWLRVAPLLNEAWDVSRWRRQLGQAVAAAGDGDTARCVGALRGANAIANGAWLPEHYDDWVLETRRQLEAELSRSVRSIEAALVDGTDPIVATEIDQLVRKLGDSAS